MLKRFLYILILAGVISGFCVYFYPSNKIEHYSYFSQKGFYEEAYKNAKTVGVSARAVIVNHHLLASNLIAEEFNILATTAPVTVLLISPNHFSVGKFAVITSKSKWKTPYGDLEPDKKFITSLVGENLAQIDEQPFLQEHGVSGLVGFVKKSLPNAKIVPIIFKDQISLKQSLDLAEKTFEVLPKNLVVVGSFDFSHYLPKNASSFHDFTSINTIESFDFQNIYNLDVDSKPGLAYYLRLVQKMGLNSFNLLENSNSSELTKQDLLESTSYINGYFNTTPTNKEQVDTLLSLGVLANNAEVYTKYSLEYLQRFFSGQDVTTAFVRQENLNTPYLFFSNGVKIIKKIEFDSNIKGWNVKIINCNNNKITQNKTEGFRIYICQNANINKIIKNRNYIILYLKGELLNKVNNFTPVGLVGSSSFLKIFLFPISIHERQFKLLVGKERDTVFMDIIKNSELGINFKNQIQNGVLELRK